jgi:hypothetical protein
VIQNAQTGIYPINIDIYGQVAKSSGGFENTLKTVVSTISIVNTPEMQLQLSKDEIGEVGEAIIYISNEGGVAKDVYISISNEDIGFLGRDVIYIDTIGENASISVTIDARNSAEGPQKLNLTMSYEDELGNSYSIYRSLPISIRKESGDLVFSQKSDIVTGEESILILEVKNEGDPIENLRFSLPENSNVELVGISEFNIGDLGRDETKTIQVPIIASTEPGSRQVSLDLKWVENNQNRISSKKMPLKVSSDAKVGVYLEAKPAPLYSDSEHTISITVSNLGSYPVEATTVEMASPAFSLLSIQPEQYIGGLNADDFSSVQYKIRTGSVPSGNYPINITVNYRDNGGEWKQETVTILASITQKPQENGNALGIIIPIVIVVVFIVYWFFIRKKQ